jgi:hypothetical protein
MEIRSQLGLTLAAFYRKKIVSVQCGLLKNFTGQLKNEGGVSNFLKSTVAVPRQAYSTIYQF